MVGIFMQLAIFNSPARFDRYSYQPAGTRPSSWSLTFSAAILTSHSTCRYPLHSPLLSRSPPPRCAWSFFALLLRLSTANAILPQVLIAYRNLLHVLVANPACRSGSSGSPTPGLSQRVAPPIFAMTHKIARSRLELYGNLC